MRVGLNAVRSLGTLSKQPLGGEVFNEGLFVGIVGEDVSKFVARSKVSIQGVNDPVLEDGRNISFASFDTPDRRRADMRNITKLFLG